MSLDPALLIQHSRPPKTLTANLLNKTPNLLVLSPCDPRRAPACINVGALLHWEACGPEVHQC